MIMGKFVNSLPDILYNYCANKRGQEASLKPLIILQRKERMGEKLGGEVG